MRWGGLTILLFIIWHLLDFTVGKINVARRGDQRPVQPARRHLRHLVDDADLPGRDVRARRCTCTTAPGAPAQTLGLTNNARARRNAKTLGWILAVVIAGGFSLVPIFVLAGVITK